MLWVNFPCDLFSLLAHFSPTRNSGLSGRAALCFVAINYCLLLLLNWSNETAWGLPQQNAWLLNLQTICSLNLRLVPGHTHKYKNRCSGDVTPWNSGFWESTTIPRWHPHQCGWHQLQADSYVDHLCLFSAFFNPIPACLPHLHGFSGWKLLVVAPVQWDTSLLQTWPPWQHPLPRNALLSSPYFSKTLISLLLMSTRHLEGNKGTRYIHTYRWMAHLI